MGAWLYQWENGDVSIVIADNRDRAVYVLDEFDAADPKRLIPLNDSAIDLQITKGKRSYKLGSLTEGLTSDVLNLIDTHRKAEKKKFRKL